MERKSIREWLMEAKEQGCEWADEALENAQNADIRCRLGVIELSLSDALTGAFSWSESPQGLAYWYDIHDKLIAQDK